MNEEILIRIVPHRDTHVLNARLYVFCRDWVGANRNDVCDATLCQRAGGLCRDETRGRKCEMRGRGCLRAKTKH